MEINALIDGDTNVALTNALDPDRKIVSGDSFIDHATMRMFERAIGHRLTGEGPFAQWGDGGTGCILPVKDG